MSNTRYILLDSTYRNREKWSLPAQFEVEVSTTGSRIGAKAQDPLSLASPNLCWKSNEFNKSGGGSAIVTLKLCDSGAAPISESNTLDVLNVCVDGTTDSLHTEMNYYRGAVLVIECDSGSGFVEVERHRIRCYTFTGTSTYDRAFITLYTSMSETSYQGLKDGTCKMTITDPTDVCSSPDNKLVFIPGGLQTSNAYINFLLYNETRCNYAYISAVENITNIAEINIEKQPESWRDDPSNPVFADCTHPSSWQNTDNYCLRQEVPLWIGKVGNNTGCATSEISIPIQHLNPDGYYDGTYLRFKNNSINGSLAGEAQRIKRICSVKKTEENPNPDTVVEFCNAFSSVPNEGDEVEILRINRDNEVFYNYSGSWLSQTQESCYVVQLLHLILPNQVLAVGYGSKTAFYPYIIVELENVCGSNSGVKNVIYSNNPHAYKALFILPLSGDSDPLLVPFVRLSGSMTQTIKFRPNDNLKMTVKIPSGEIFQTVLEETYAPSPPNPLKQISALFSIRKL